MSNVSGHMSIDWIDWYEEVSGHTEWVPVSKFDLVVTTDLTGRASPWSGCLVEVSLHSEWVPESDVNVETGVYSGEASRASGCCDEVCKARVCLCETEFDNVASSDMACCSEWL